MGAAGQAPVSREAHRMRPVRSIVEGPRAQGPGSNSLDTWGENKLEKCMSHFFCSLFFGDRELITVLLC